MSFSAITSVQTSSPLPVEKSAVSICKQTEEKVADVMSQMIREKEEKVKLALARRLNPSEAILVGGDVFTTGYLAFKGLELVKPSLSSIPAIAISSFVFGEVAGAINLGVSLVCLKEALQALDNGDKKLALRLFIDFVDLALIGAVMVLASLSTKIGALGGVGAFFTAFPWVLPILFLIMSFPCMVEVSHRIKNIVTGQDLGARLQEADLQKLIRGNDPNDPYNLSDLFSLDDAQLRKELSKKLEVFQANIGVEAAVETFKVLEKLLRKEALDEQLEKAKQKVKEWNRAQYVRLFQQILYGSAFVASMVSLSPKINGSMVEAATNFAMTGANAIPTYMDAFWPFKRNTTLVVPKVEEQV